MVAITGTGVTFKVHWQIDSPKPGYIDTQKFNPAKVKLQVESPKINIDEVLNKIKSDLVIALLQSRLQEKASQKGFSCGVGRLAQRTSENKSTTVFGVIIPDSRFKDRDEDNIALVHGVGGDIVDDIVKRFVPKLNRYFGRANSELS